MTMRSEPSVPETPKIIRPTYAKPGIEVWHADCFTIFPSLAAQSVDLVLADLPYGTTQCRWDSVLPLDSLWAEYRRILKPNGAVVLTAAQPFTWQLCASNPAWFKYEIIWEKPNGTNPLVVHFRPFPVHENVLVFYARQPTYNPEKTFGHAHSSAFADASKTIGEVYGGTKNGAHRLISKHNANTDGSRFPRSVLRFPQDRTGHPTKKPVALMRWLVRTYTNVGDVVLDNTMGEGTTGVACILEQRRFQGIEIHEPYYEVAVKAIEEQRRDTCAFA